MIFRPWLLCAALLLSLTLPVRGDELVVQTYADADHAAVAFSPDGKLMATGGVYRVVRLWNVETGKVLRVIDGHDGWVRTLAFSRDSKVLVSGSYNGLVVWTEVESGRELQRTRLKSELGSADFSPDGKTLAGPSGDGVAVWDVETRQPRPPLAIGRADLASSLRYSPDGRFLIGARPDGVLVLDAVTGGLWRRVQTASEPIVAVPSSGSTVAVSAGRNALLLLDLRALEVPPRTIDLQTTGAKDLGTVKQLQWTGRGTLLAGFADSLAVIELDTDGKVLAQTSVGRRDEVRTFDARHDRVFGSIAMGGQLTWYRAQTGEVLRRLDAARTSDYFGAQFRPGTHALTFGVSPVRVLDLESGLGSKVVADSTRPGNWSADGRLFVTVKQRPDPQHAKPLLLDLWNERLDRPVRSLSLAETSAFQNVVEHPPLLSPDGKLVACLTDAGAALWDSTTGALVRELKGPGPSGKVLMKAIAFVPGRAQLAGTLVSGPLSGRFFVWGLDSGEVVDQVELERTPGMYLSVTSGGRYAVWDDFVRDLNAKTMLAFRCDGFCAGSAISPDEKTLVLTEATGRHRFFDLSAESKQKPLVRTVEAVPGFREPSFSDDGRFLVARGASALMLWNLKSDQRALFVASGSDWVVATPDGYFDAAREGGRLLAIVRGTTAYGVDQFAAARNRPDLLLERLQLGGEALRQHYKNQYLKRLRKLGLSEERLSAELAAPEAVIVSAVREGKFVDLQARCTDSRLPLKRYSIYLNDVPLRGAEGTVIQGAARAIAERVELTAGENKIEVSCTNAAEAESLRALTSVRFDGEAPRDLYFLGFGVSKYLRPELELGFAHKDAADLAKLFAAQRQGYREVFTKTWLNEEVTPKAMVDAKVFLARARPDDVVVLFIAGHGIHDIDAEATYYFLTHDADPANLAGTAANFELVEGLLQGIAPRSKLFLIDTCESGEAEQGGQTAALAAGSSGARSRGLRKGFTSQPGPARVPRNQLQDRGRFIYNDLVRRSGAVVISSSRGGELSYEDERLKNGYFTSAILQALSSGVADANGDRQISIEELRTYVAQTVSEQSNGLQNPTIDRDNLAALLQFPVAPPEPPRPATKAPARRKR